MDLITTHVNTDFDALAAMVAALRLYPGAAAAFSGAQEQNVRDFLKSPFWTFDIRKARDIDRDAVRRLILVDTKNRRRIGPFAELLGRPDLEVHVYDHHPVGPSDIRGQVEVIDEGAALTTMMVEQLRRRKFRIPPPEATVYALGIYEETGFFGFPSVSERDFLAMAYLRRRGANLEVVKRFLGREPTPEQIEVLNELLQTGTELPVGPFVVFVAKASRETYLPDAAMLAHKLRDMTDCDAVFVLLRLEGRIHIIARSRVPEIDVGRLLEVFGGGGHRSAASAVVRKNALESTEEELRARLLDGVRSRKTARDIMTAPVTSIGRGATVGEAEAFLTKYGFNVVPIVNGAGDFQGVISREVVERSIHHGFSDRPVLDFATTDPVSVGPDTPMAAVEAVMIERNRKFLPVMEGRRVVGAITRTDLLRVLYDETLRRGPVDREADGAAERSRSRRTLRRRLREKFPTARYALLETCGRIAEETGCRAYLVGGSVRDLLRNERNLDFDIVVEGDGIAFAEALVARTGGRVRSHRRFNTAVVILPDGFKLDVATARTEYYESPAVLPTVEASSIKKDLYRRDFTVNTLAVQLDRPAFGTLIDFFGGQRDLKDRTIRILHNLSFVEDPTRAFRAVRFALRFGFRVGKHTANLIRTAVKMDLFSRLSGSRLYDELLLLFSETRPAGAFKALNRFELLGVIHPKLRFSRERMAALDRMEKVLEWYRLLYLDDRPDEGALLMLTLLDGLEPGPLREVLDRLQVPPRIRRKIEEGSAAAAEALQVAAQPGWKAVFHGLRNMDTEFLLLAMARTKDPDKERTLATFISEIRYTAPQLTGKELRAMGYPPGPLYQEILRALLDARLDGEVRTKYDETRLVRERFGTPA